MRDDIGHASYLQARTAAVIAANPHLAARITGKPAPVVEAPPVIRARPIYEKGRYIPRSLAGLTAFVARQSCLHPDAICGNGQTAHIVDARSCIAALAVDFAPRQSAASIDDALLRGSGWTIWTQSRHADRMQARPAYAALYQRCRDVLAEAA